MMVTDRTEVTPLAHRIGLARNTLYGFALQRSHCPVCDTGQTLPFEFSRTDPGRQSSLQTLRCFLIDFSFESNGETFQEIRRGRNHTAALENGQSNILVMQREIPCERR